MSQKPPQNLTSVSGFVSSRASGRIPVSITISSSVDHFIGADAARAEKISLALSAPAYHELLENPHVEIDGLQRLEENLARLEDLHGRLQFLMRDVTGLLRRR